MTLRRGSLAWALASILFPRCLSWFFRGWGRAACLLALGAYRRCGRAATTGRGAAAGGVSAATAGAAATVAIVAPVMVAVTVMVPILILVLVAVVAPAKPGPRMTFVLAGKGRG